MKKALAVGWAGIAFAFVAAGGCGSSVTDTGSPDGGADAGPRGCPTLFGSNAPPCDQPGLVCPGAPTPCVPNTCCPESIITCGSDGVWVGSTRPRVCPDFCPSVFPETGEPCMYPDRTCVAGRPCASPCECPRLVATCRNGAWDVVDTNVPPPSCADAGGDASPLDAGEDGGER